MVEKSETGNQVLDRIFESMMPKINLYRLMLIGRESTMEWMPIYRARNEDELAQLKKKLGVEEDDEGNQLRSWPEYPDIYYLAEDAYRIDLVRETFADDMKSKIRLSGKYRNFVYDMFMYELINQGYADHRDADRVFEALGLDRDKVGSTGKLLNNFMKALEDYARVVGTLKLVEEFQDREFLGSPRQDLGKGNNKWNKKL